MQRSLVDILYAAATILVKAEQDTSGSLKDARPHCAARIALSKAVSCCLLATDAKASKSFTLKSTSPDACRAYAHFVYQMHLSHAHCD